MGKEIEKNKELAKRIIQEGHFIGMHSYSHSRFRSLNFKDRRREILSSKEVLKKELGIECVLFRPPQGSISFSQILYCAKKRITTVLWSIDSRDFEYKGSEYIVNNVIGNGIKGGDIVLLHDDNEFTVCALPKIIDYLRKKKFEFVTVGEML